MLGISPREVSFSVRGFHLGDHETRSRLEAAGAAFVRGYQLALDIGEPEHVGRVIDATEGRARASLARGADTDHGGGGRADGIGFVFEGAAMALSLLDALSPIPGDRLARFREGPAARSVYTVNVGVGWALARLPRWRWRPLLCRLDPLLGWLAWDGYGFHQVFFHPREPVRAPLPGYVAHATAQGAGRALWFFCCGDADLVAGEVRRYRPEFHGDVWSGVGLAATYAGGPQDHVTRLPRLAGAHAPALAQGAAFAAKARIRLGVPPAHTEAATLALAGVGSAEAAAVTDRVLAGLAGHTGPVPAYEEWRRRVARELTTTGSSHVA